MSDLTAAQAVMAAARGSAQTDDFATEFEAALLEYGYVVVPAELALPTLSPFEEIPT